MPKILVSAICRSSAIDERTNILSLFDFIEEVQTEIVNLKGKPEAVVPVPLNFQIIHVVARSDWNVPESFEFRCSVLLPNGRKVEARQTDSAVELTQHKRMRIVMSVDNLPVSNSGLYEFLFEHKYSGDGDWIEVSRYPLEVTVVERSMPERPQEAAAQSHEQPSSEPSPSGE